MANSVGELSVKLGFDVDQKTVKNFDDSISNLNKNMLGAVAGGDLLADSLKNLYKVTIDQVPAAIKIGATWEQIAMQTGIAADELQRYSTAFSTLSGGTRSPLEVGQAIADLDAKLYLYKKGLATPPPWIATAGINLGEMHSGLQLLQTYSAMARANPSQYTPQRVSQDLSLIGVGSLGVYQSIMADPGKFKQIENDVSLTTKQINTLNDAQNALNISTERYQAMWERMVADIIPKATDSVKSIAKFIEDIFSKIEKEKEDFDKDKSNPYHFLFNQNPDYLKNNKFLQDLNNWNKSMSAPGGSNIAPQDAAPGYLPPVQDYNSVSPYNQSSNTTNHVVIHTTDSAYNTLKDFQNNQYMFTQNNLNNGAFA